MPASGYGDKAYYSGEKGALTAFWVYMLRGRDSRETLPSLQVTDPRNGKGNKTSGQICAAALAPW